MTELRHIPLNMRLGFAVTAELESAGVAALLTYRYSPCGIARFHDSR